MADILSTLTGALGTLYLLLVLGFAVGLQRLRPGASTRQERVTVVVPAHNEAANIDACLSALAEQHYPSHLVEIIVVDDRSTDDTAKRAQKWQHRIPGLKVVPVEHQYHACPKKNALQHGIQAGRGNLVLTTDADCRPAPGWIAATVRCFDPEVGMVAGQAPLVQEAGFLKGLLSLQGFLVTALAAGSTGLGVPLTCSGRNLAYRRSAFQEAGGFNAIGHITGGDDVLLMRQVAARTRWRIRFNPDPCARVPSAPHSDHLLGRQIRYQSKAIHYGIRILLLAFLLYIFHMMLILGPVLSWALPAFGPTFGLVLATKIGADACLVWRADVRLETPSHLKWLPVLEAISIPYIVYFCALGVFKPLRWK